MYCWHMRLIRFPNSCLYDRHRQGRLLSLSLVSWTCFQNKLLQQGLSSADIILLSNLTWSICCPITMNAFPRKQTLLFLPVREEWQDNALRYEKRKRLDSLTFAFFLALCVFRKTHFLRCLHWEVLCAACKLTSWTLYFTAKVCLFRTNVCHRAYRFLYS